MNYIEKMDLMLEVLDAFPASARIVGGAVRDMVLDKPIKDIDVFVPASDFDVTAFDDIGLVSGEDYGAPAEFDVYRVYDFDIPVDVMVSYVPFSEYIAGFDYGICQVWMDQGGRVEGTPAYESDVLNKTLTALPEGRESGSHRERLLAKFPDYREVPR